MLSIIDDPSEFQGDYIIEDELVWACATDSYRAENNSISLVVAPEGCIYRKRAIERLQQANIPWNVTYTIMDIGGITSVVEEGLGITVLAKKTLPESLKIIAPPLGAKPLGRIGLTLLYSEEGHMSEVSHFLADYIKLQL